jgi:hypothetical protein
MRTYSDILIPFFGGEGGIRTLESFDTLPHFECGALDQTMRPLHAYLVYASICYFDK